MKKTLAILLAVLMLCSALPALADTANLNLEGYPIVKEPITVSLTGPRNAQSHGWDAENCPQVAYLTELTGIVFEDRSYSSDAWGESKNLMFASDDIPDLVLAYQFSNEELLDLGSQGILIELEDLIAEYMPNLQQIFEQFPEAKAKITSANGHIYTFPDINAVVRDVHNRYWINVKWLEKIGKEIPTTLDELYEVLKLFKSEDANDNGDPNDEIPISCNAGSSGMDGLILNAMGINVRSADFQFTADDDGNVYCSNTSDAYKEYLKYMNKLWNEGLMDEEYFTQTSEQRVAKAKEGIIGVCNTAAMYIDAGVEIGYNWEQFDALTSDINDTRMVSNISFVRTMGAITKACENPEAVARLIDYFFGPEGDSMGYVGVEGVSWAWTDKEAGLWDKIAPEGYETPEVYRQVATIISGWPHYTSTKFNKGQGSFNALWLDDMSYNRSMPYFKLAFPSLAFDEDDSETIQQYTTDLASYAANMRATFITGAPDAIDAGWDAYVNQMNAMGVAELLPIYQAGYDAYLATVE